MSDYRIDTAALKRPTTDAGVVSNEKGPGWDAFVRDLGHELAKRRRAAGLSQDAVAAAAGLARSQYQRLERGLVSADQPANPTLATLLAISQVLEVPLTELIPDRAPDIRIGRAQGKSGQD